jgi:hypothetical protein
MIKMRRLVSFFLMAGILSIGAARTAGTITPGSAPPQVASSAAGYKNLSVAVYFRYQEVASTPNNMASFAQQWANIEKQVHVSKV